MMNTYRYLLTRVLSRVGPHGVYVMLNPSTADETTDDPTIRKCRGFAERWGWGSFSVVNLFAVRATDPQDLHASVRLGSLELAYGPENEVVLTRYCPQAGPVVVGWGSHGVRYRAHIERIVTDILPSTLQCLGTTRSGHPRHPLMVAYHTELEPWSLERLS